MEPDDTDNVNEGGWRARLAAEKAKLAKMNAEIEESRASEARLLARMDELNSILPSERTPSVRESLFLRGAAAARLGSIRLSCQDLDKTTYLHGAPEANKRNLLAMQSFEAVERGGTHVAVFVTGNNVAMA